MSREYKYTEEFKVQIAKLRESGKPISAMCKALQIDNAVAEAMYNVVKIEFAFQREFANFDELELLWIDYIN